jgi:hypothetical protein
MPVTEDDLAYLWDMLEAANSVEAGQVALSGLGWQSPQAVDGDTKEDEAGQYQ